MSGEHLWSAWVGELFPATSYKFSRRDDFGTALNEWTRPNVDLKSNDTCRTCNNGWMSDLESQYAKPAMKDMILHGARVLLTPQRVAAISAFAFKTAVIAEHMKQRNSPFFSAATRRQFARTLEVPPDVLIWLASYSGVRLRGGIFKSAYLEGSLPDGNRLKAYLFTWKAGHLVLQLLAPTLIPARGKRLTGTEQYDINSRENFDDFIVPIWPYVGPFPWPTGHHLGDDSLQKFSDRWGGITYFPKPTS